MQSEGHPNFSPVVSHIHQFVMYVKEITDVCTKKKTAQHKIMRIYSPTNIILLNYDFNKKENSGYNVHKYIYIVYTYMTLYIVHTCTCTLYIHDCTCTLYMHTVYT